MRQISVKEGSSKYKLKGDDGTLIGELIINYNSQTKACLIDVAKRGATIESLTIGV